MRKPTYHELYGKSHTIKEWAKIFCIAPATVYNRMHRGFTLARALTEPLCNGGRKYVTILDETRSVAQWAKASNLHNSTISRRLRDGYKDEDLISSRYTGEKITAFGKTMTFSQWEKETGINRSTIEKRIKVSGLTPELALTLPVQKMRKPNRQTRRGPSDLQLITAFGRTQTWGEWEKETGIKRQTLHWRTKVRKPPMTLEQAITRPIGVKDKKTGKQLRRKKGMKHDRKNY